MFGKNELVTVLLGQCYYYNGDHDIALTHLQRAHASNFYILDGLSNNLNFVFKKPTKWDVYFLIIFVVIDSDQVYWVQFMRKMAVQPNWKN